MNTNRIMALSALIGLGWAVEGQPQEFLTNGLVAYYPFNGNARDQSGNDLNGSLLGDPQPIKDRFGVPGAAFKLNGLTDWILTPGSPHFNLTNAITIAFWVKAGITETRRCLALVSYSKGDNDQYAVAFNTRYRLQFTYFTGVFHDTVDTSDAIWTDQVWHQACVMVQPSANTVLLYRDGTLLGSYLSNFGGAPIPSVRGAQLYIGLNPGENVCFPGSIDDVRIYDRALSAKEVAQLNSIEAPRSAPN